MNDLTVLCMTAATIGFVHTALGPDHYVPFIVMGKARQWSRGRLAAITVACGVGHVASSIVLGFIGIGLGAAVTSLTAVEEHRGALAAWALIAFGFVYFLWGLRAARHEHGHSHQHAQDDCHVHSAHDGHADEQLGDRGGSSAQRDLTPWILFTVFVLGPCEPLIPVLMYPAATAGLSAAAIVALVFCLVTVATMTAIVLLVSAGISFVSINRLERYTHALAGATICCSGLAVQFLGL